MAEGLNGLMREAKKKNLYVGYKVGKRECEISLLQFFDEALFVGEVNVRNVFTIKVILRLFELVWDLELTFIKVALEPLVLEVK